MGLINRAKNAIDSLIVGRKDRTVQKISSRRLIKAIPTTLKEKLRKHVRKIVDNWNDDHHSYQSNLIEFDADSSSFGSEDFEDVDSNINSAQPMSEEAFQSDEHDQHTTITNSIEAEEHNITVDRLSEICASKASSVVINDTPPIPEAAWFRSNNRDSAKLDTVQDIDEKSATTETVAKIYRTSSPLRLPKFINIVSKGGPDARRCELVAKCFDQSTAKDEWIPIAEGQHGQNYAARYLPTIVHENKKMLDKFLQAFRDQSSNDEIYKALRLAEIAFDSLDRHLKEAGLLDCVVEFLKPANHPNRILEELQRARSEILNLQRKYRELQDKLNALTEKGTATDVQRETRASIAASELAALLEDRDKWYKEFQAIYTTMKERTESLDGDLLQYFEGIQEPRLACTEHLSSQSDQSWLEKQLEEQKAKYETLKFIKESDETRHAAEIASYQTRLLESEPISHLTPEQLGEEALATAMCEAEEFKRLYTESCLTVAELENDLAIARQYGLELGVIAEQAERLHEMRLPKTVCTPPPHFKTASSDQVDEEDIDRSRFTDDPDIF